jgi:hypothetical protein
VAVSDTLGHSDIRITRIARDIYQAILDDLARAAAEAVIELVPRTRTKGGTSHPPEAVRRMPGMTQPQRREADKGEADGPDA